MSTNGELVGLYRVEAAAGNLGTPGAPILHLSLLVNAPTGAITGHAVQTQAVEGPYGKIDIAITKGKLRHASLGKFTELVALEGSALISFPPPAVGSYLAPFTAQFAIDDSWNGTGGWTLSQTDIEEVPIKSKG